MHKVFVEVNNELFSVGDLSGDAAKYVNFPFVDVATSLVKVEDRQEYLVMCQSKKTPAKLSMDNTSPLQSQRYSPCSYCYARCHH